MPVERPERTILKKSGGMPMEVMLKSEIVRETLKAKSYDLKQVETGNEKIGDELRRLSESLAEDRPVVQTNDKDEPEVSILRRDEAAYGEDSLKEKQPRWQGCRAVTSRESPGRETKADHGSKEEGEIQRRDRTPWIGSRVRGVGHIRRRG